jgi:hypothetical protein
MKGIAPMPTANDFFPSNYVRAADLKGKEVNAIIDKVTVESFENDGKRQSKPVIVFKGDTLKPMVCNRTNFAIIAKLHGDNSDNWSGKPIGLRMELVSFKGAISESIRVKQPAEGFNDAVPF